MTLTSANPADAVNGYMLEPAAAPGPVAFQPPPTMQPAREWKPSFWAILDGVLGGDTITEARRREIARHEGMIDDGNRRALAEALFGGNPRELLTYITDPQAWAGESAKNAGPIKAGAGDTIYQPGEEPRTAPKTGVAGDTYYTQTPEGVQEQGRRAPSFKEQADAEAARLQAIQRARELAAKIANWSEGRVLQRQRMNTGGGASAAPAGFGGLPAGYRPRN